MSNVVSLNEAMSRMLARELGLSVAFVEICSRIDITPQQGKEILRWFLTRTLGERLVVAKGTLRGVRRARARGKVLRLLTPPAVERPVEDVPEPEPILSRAHLAASFEGATRRADVDGTLTLNPASYAGMLLDRANGDVAVALADIPTGTGPYLATVRSYLESLSGDKETTT